MPSYRAVGAVIAIALSASGCARAELARQGVRSTSITTFGQTRVFAQYERDRAQAELEALLNEPPPQVSELDDAQMSADERADQSEPEPLPALPAAEPEPAAPIESTESAPIESRRIAMANDSINAIEEPEAAIETEQVDDNEQAELAQLEQEPFDESSEVADSRQQQQEEEPRVVLVIQQPFFFLLGPVGPAVPLVPQNGQLSAGSRAFGVGLTPPSGLPHAVVPVTPPLQSGSRR